MVSLAELGVAVDCGLHGLAAYPQSGHLSSFPPASSSVAPIGTERGHSGCKDISAKILAVFFFVTFPIIC